MSGHRLYERKQILPRIITPEEQAVIDAAEAMYQRVAYLGHPRPEEAERALDMAVQRLRESRKPKPKWRIESGPYVTDGEVYLAVAEDYALRVCDLLNKADPA